MRYGLRRITLCHCCGMHPATQAVGMPDLSGHIWTHHVCCRCVTQCDYDDNGNPACNVATPATPKEGQA